MRNLLDRVLCALGRHDWVEWQAVPPWGGDHRRARRCLRCKLTVWRWMWYWMTEQEIARDLPLPTPRSFEEALARRRPRTERIAGPGATEIDDPLRLPQGEAVTFTPRWVREE